MPYTIQELLQSAASQLCAVNTSRAMPEARLLLAKVLNCRIEDLIIKDDRHVSENEKGLFEVLVKRRLNYEPMAYLLERKEFFGINFKIRSPVLIPRPETEGLVLHVLQWIQSADMQKGVLLDLGSGSGCIALALAQNVAAHIQVYALEKSEEALELATENQSLVQKQVHWIKGDILAGPSNELSGLEFDILVSNPPYIPSVEMAHLPPDILNFESRDALNGGIDGLDFFRAIVTKWLPRLKSPGLLALECAGFEQLERLRRLFDSSIEILLDSPYLLLKR